MINRWFYMHLPHIRQVLTRIIYEYISLFDNDAIALFLNYGFADLDLNSIPLELPAEDEENRYPIQLYYHVAKAIDWYGLEALEVSSGRGGGSRFIKQHFQPKQITGIDFSRKAVSFCNRYYSIDGLSFTHGNAESLPFPNNSFDIILNIEASFYYPNFRRFLNHVIRVLKPGGYFLYADMRYKEEIETWRAQLRDSGLQLVREEDITCNVVKALAMDHNRRRNLVNQYVPNLFRGLFSQFVGITYAGLARSEPKIGERIYLYFVLRKKDSSDKKLI